ncbi:GPI anchored protein [Drechmeria coniospora]|uniref:GPI anchored protein n=1 Tax=Drechmeria coniospora TaxID=98403 RepID=A0A151GT47_DRECN|nr:GPI anchored protein [Drechmeria coniospora]KYK60294.1 GPI anchored protein [Drechmeria coniospora]
MAPLSSILLLQTSFLVLASHAAASQQQKQQQLLAAIKKLSPDSNEKLFPEHLSFAPLTVFPREAAQFFAYDNDDDEDLQLNETARFFLPAFARHQDDGEPGLLRRAAEALTLLQRQASCPVGMKSCADQGAPNKCCQEGTYCAGVADANVGQVACCPLGTGCTGGVGSCPSDATSCSSELGGGCCIPGFVCQGAGCVPSASATTTAAAASPSSTMASTTSTTTSNIAAGSPPWRPTGSPETTTAWTSGESATQSGCPTGFYGCLATHGGGCCRTDRQCQTSSCPPAPLTTMVANGVTIVVPVGDVPRPTATTTCANGWFMCGSEAGPVAGCCPSGYSCGTASCFTAQASQTGSRPKLVPGQSAASRAGAAAAGMLLLGPALGACLVMMHALWW